MYLLLLAAEGSGQSQLVEAFKQNPTFMVLNLFVSAIVLTIVIERFAFQMTRYRVNSNEFFAQVKKLVMAGNIDRAIKLCNSVPSAVLPRVVKQGLLAAHKGRSAVSAALEEGLMENTPLLQKRVQTLWSLANIATLIGLIGTIVGLIRAFAAVSLATPEQKTALLTKGISEAMNNTAFGLGIAVTNIIAHLFILGQAKRMIDDMELAALRMENLLSSRVFAVGGEDEEQAAARS